MRYLSVLRHRDANLPSLTMKNAYLSSESGQFSQCIIELEIVKKNFVPIFFVKYLPFQPFSHIRCKMLVLTGLNYIRVKENLHVSTKNFLHVSNQISMS